MFLLPFIGPMTPLGEGSFVGPPLVSLLGLLCCPRVTLRSLTLSLLVIALSGLFVGWPVWSCVLSVLNMVCVVAESGKPLNPGPFA
eukprot:4728100-Amphidinium_carterae.1